MKQKIEFAIGTQAKYLVGCSLVRNVDQDKYKLVQTFAEEAHQGSIKCVAASSNFLVSGGTDEVIKIYDMSTKRDAGSLMEQEGTITCLNFIDEQHLMSASEDSTLCVWRTSNWKCAKTLKGHKGAVTGLAIHPAGGLALSTSKDKTLRTWDLVKGRCAFIKNIHEIANSILWSPNGKNFVVLFDRRIDIFDVSTDVAIHDIPFTKDVHCCQFLSETILMVGLEDGSIEMINILNCRSLKNQKIHENRIKNICVTRKGILTCSSDGTVQFFRGQRFTSLASIDLGTRITCMSIFKLT